MSQFTLYQGTTPIQTAYNIVDLKCWADLNYATLANHDLTIKGPYNQKIQVSITSCAHSKEFYWRGAGESGFVSNR